MEDKSKHKKKYVKPNVRRVELSLAEVTLATGCDTGITSPQDPGCELPGGCDTQ